MLLPDRDTVRSRGRRRRRSRDDLGEGCSYLMPSEIGSPSRLQDVTTTEDIDNSSIITCTCYSTSSSTIQYTRSRRLAALAVLSTAVSSASLHASASPVDVMGSNGGGRQQRDRKGKGRALLSDEDGFITPYNDIKQSFTPQRQSALQYARLGKRDLDIDSSETRAESRSRSRSRRRRSSSSTQQRRSNATPDSHSNTPDGVPSHYEYINGEWVPSADWSLNGQNGARHASNSKSNSVNDSLDEEDTPASHTDDGDSSTRQNNVATPAANEEEGEVGTTTIGWAKSTNAVLGVDIDTSLAVSSSGHPTATSISPEGTLASSNQLVTRSNMATYTASSSGSASSATLSPSSSGGSTTTTTNNNNNQQAYDFSRDVPNGWVIDGRTEAYAVPVIIGMSVFLALVIFGLILVLLRMNKSRRKRRKAVLNGGLKLSEEGKVMTRPSSPALSHRTGSQNNDNGDEDYNDNEGGLSSSVSSRRRRARTTAIPAEEDLNEEEAKATGIRRRIGRKWTPNMSSGAALRKRRTKIAQLFKRGDAPVQEVIVVDGDDAEDGAEGARVSSDSSSSLRRRSVSSTSNAALGDGSDPSDALSRTASNTSNISVGASRANAADADDSDRTYIRPPSLRVDTATASSADENPASSGQPRVPHARNDSIDAGDHHAVPVPSVGPPAYMQPSTPAYSRAPGGESSASSSNHLSAIPASGYLSNVSTPGLMSAGMDEKRALLGGAGLMSGAGAGQDAFANQRRFEHLYQSREGDEDRLEQMTGAPTFSSSSTFAVPSSSSSSSRQRGHGDSEESDEVIARRAQQEAIEDHRRELQESLAGHVALSDKEVLGRLRMAASAPSTIDSESMSIYGTESSPSLSIPSTRGSAAPGGQHMQEASAPSLDEAEEEELHAYLSTEQQQHASPSPSASVSGQASMLPAPPRAFTHASALHQIPQVDEKTRLRQAEERHFSSFSPVLLDGSEGATMSPSAPPVTTSSASAEASAPSAPVFDEQDEEVEYAPSAPPFEMASAPSAPTYVLEEEEEEEASGEVESRPYNEGVI